MTLKKHGEFEGGDFWEEHDELLKQAWQERVPVYTSLYQYDSAFEENYLHPKLREAAEQAREGQEQAAFALFEDGCDWNIEFASTELKTLTWDDRCMMYLI